MYRMPSVGTSGQSTARPTTESHPVFCATAGETNVEAAMAATIKLDLPKAAGRV